MFATMIVVLPSEFSGGDVLLSHNGKEVVYACSWKSSALTTILAWYTDVKHEVRPVTSGYRLALAYNLIHTTQTLRPALPLQSVSVEDIGRVFRSWNDSSGDNTPKKIIYLLEYQYSQANLNASALKGIDAHKVALLAGEAQRYNICLGLANVEAQLRGEIGDDRRYVLNFKHSTRR